MATTQKNYWNSSHRWTYIWIGLTHLTSPQRVYRLAHGIEEVHGNTRSIMHALKKYGIIKKHHH